MSYLASARKWRPQEFKDLVGQDHVVQTLKNAISHNRVSHAYLFSGPRGIGKTSVARIFAKALRCPNGEMPESEKIAQGKSLDVVEIDGASNNGVESVRSIRENVAYGASSGTYKIYIIDEVHMLSLSAFNALLKTLEEPPSHVIFIFATTEAHKIPMTILSRCQRFEFRRLTSPQILERLKLILAEEKFSISEDGLRVIARHSDGALRDALSLLDQVLSHYSDQTDKELTDTHIVEALGITNMSAPLGFVQSIVAKDSNEILSLVEQTFFSGIDLKHFSERVLEEIRNLYLIKLTSSTSKPINAEQLQLTESHFDTLFALAKKCELIQIERMSQILSNTISKLSWVALPRYVLEMAAVRMANLDGLSEIEAAILQPKSGNVSEPKAPPASRPTPSPQLETAPPAPQKIEAPTPKAPTGPKTPADQWKEVVGTISKKRPLLGALISHANFKLEKSGEQKKVVIAFEEGSFYEKQANEKKSKEDITSLIKEHFGSDTLVELSNALSNTEPSLEKVRDEENAQLKKNALEHSSVQKAKEALGAEIVGVNINN